MPSGLRKVTDDMKLMNRKDRVGIVSSGENKAHKSVPSATKDGTPKLELLIGRKWVVTNQVGVKDLCIDECYASQTIYIFGCKDSVIHIKGKVNSIIVDKCTRMGVVFTGAAPTISIENTSGFQLYLSKDSIESFITTAKSSEVNVMVRAEDLDADMSLVNHVKISELMSHLEDKRERANSVEEQLYLMKNLLSEHQKSMEQYQIERATYQKVLAKITQMYEQKINDLVLQMEDEHARSVRLEELVILLQKASTNNQSSLQVSC
nr:cyclase-associated protein 1-like [Tanacetum cinerariifolium]